MSNVTEAWLLNNTVRRCVLVVIQYFDVIAVTDTGKYMYLGTKGYTPTNGEITFIPIITGGLKFDENLSIDGGLSATVGDIEINNPNGEYDTWLDSTKYIWANRTVKIYYGDPDWVSADLATTYTNFELIFDGLLVDIGSRSRDKLNFRIRDKMERLNAPLTETKLGVYGTWGTNQQPNVDATKPLVFGEVFNITPLQIDPSTLEYMVNSGVTEGLIEVRDNGVPIYNSGLTGGANVTNLATAGTFKLNQALAGVATCSVQGVKRSINLTTQVESATYANNIANLVALITMKFGKSYTQLVAADIDFTNFLAYETANNIPVGIYVTDGASVLEVCKQLCSSLATQLFFNRQGKLQLLKLGVPTSDTNIDITDRDILFHSLSITARTEVMATVKLGYCKNWTVQEGLVTGIPQAHKDMFATDWMTYTPTVDSTVQSRYKLTSDPVQKDTALLTTSNATTEANRLQTYYKVPHTVYSFVGTPRMMLLKLGQPVTLTHSRFGLNSGASGQVVALSPNWSTGQVNVGVLI